MYNVIKREDLSGKEEVITSTQAKYEIWYNWHRDLCKKNSFFSGLSDQEFDWNPDEIEEFLFTTEKDGYEFGTYTHTYWRA